LRRQVDHYVWLGAGDRGAKRRRIAYVHPLVTRQHGVDSCSLEERTWKRIKCDSVHSGTKLMEP
jgi:hypothetical protein